MSDGAAGDIVGNSKPSRAVLARAWVSFIAVRHSGLSCIVAARKIGVSTQSVWRGTESGGKGAGDWSLKEMVDRIRSIRSD